MNIKVWTIQFPNVLDIIEKNEIYIADLKESRYIKRKNINSVCFKQEIMNLEEQEMIYFDPVNQEAVLIDFKREFEAFYKQIIRIFNEANNMNLSGIIYGFCKQDNNKIGSYDNISQFRMALEKNKKLLAPFLNTLNSDCKILELDFDVSSINVIPVGYKQFERIMPPCIYKKETNEKKEILSIIRNMLYKLPPADLNVGDIIQCHLPWIKKENIVNIYSLSSRELQKHW